MDTIIITGVCSAIGRLLAEKLSEQYQIIGIDRKQWKSHRQPDPLSRFYEGDIRRRIFPSILSQYRKTIKAVIHLAVSRNYALAPEKLHESNIIACRNVLDTVMDYQVSKFVLLSDHSVYGAIPGNILWLKENAPLNGGRIFKENTSIVEVDLMCAELFWRSPQIETVILRPVNVLGPQTSGLLNTYLKLGVAPAVMGFNPMMQVIHEQDLLLAVETALQPELKGIYNVVGPGSLPLPVLAKEAGLTQIPMPFILAKNTVRFLAPTAYKLGQSLFGIKPFPCPVSGLSFFQFGISIDGTSFKQATRFKPQYSLIQTVQSINSKQCSATDN